MGWREHTACSEVIIIFTFINPRLISKVFANVFAKKYFPTSNSRLISIKKSFADKGILIQRIPFKTHSLQNLR